MNNIDEPKFNRVVAYVRKSSEDNIKGESNKQLNSIKYQREFVERMIRKNDLKLVRRPFEDNKTGYEAFVRDGFEDMLSYLRDNTDKVDGILCTEISRLARNFGDGGIILWYMQKGIIKRIYTVNKTFTNSSDDQLMVAIHFAMSKKSSDETGQRSKLGMTSKVKNMGHPARGAILGYKTIGPTGAKKWRIHPKNGPLVKKVFERYASGKYTLKEITGYAHSIGLVSKSSKSKTGIISVNTWRNRLKDETYTGIFYHERERIAGAYKPLIDNNLFFAVQRVLEFNAHPKTGHMIYAYTGMFSCPDCGRKLSGTHKKGHTYYRCDKRTSPCKDKKKATYVREEVLEKELVTAFNSIEIDQETWEASREYIAEINKPEKAEIRRQLNIIDEKIQKEIDQQTKTERRYQNNELSKAERTRLIDYSREEERKLKEIFSKLDNFYYELNSIMEKFLDEIKHITKRFKTISPENKRELVDIFCENLKWNGKKAQWDWKKPYFLIVNKRKSSTWLPG